MIDLTEQQFLHAVFRLSRSTKPFTVETVAKVAGITATQAAWALISLGRAGLVDSDRLRLTLTGLAAAAHLEDATRLERRERIRIRAWFRGRSAAPRLFDEAVLVG